jgi:hypothetical protein
MVLGAVVMIPVAASQTRPPWSVRLQRAVNDITEVVERKQIASPGSPAFVLEPVVMVRTMFGLGVVGGAAIAPVP